MTRFLVRAAISASILLAQTAPAMEATSVSSDDHLHIPILTIIVPFLSVPLAKYLLQTFIFGGSSTDLRRNERVGKLLSQIPVDIADCDHCLLLSYDDDRQLTFARAEKPSRSDLVKIAKCIVHLEEKSGTQYLRVLLTPSHSSELYQFLELITFKHEVMEHEFFLLTHMLSNLDLDHAELASMVKDRLSHSPTLLELVSLLPWPMDELFKSENAPINCSLHNCIVLLRTIISGSYRDFTCALNAVADEIGDLMWQKNYFGAYFQLIQDSLFVVPINPHRTRHRCNLF